MKGSGVSKEPVGTGELSSISILGMPELRTDALQSKMALHWRS